MGRRGPITSCGAAEVEEEGGGAPKTAERSAPNRYQVYPRQSDAEAARAHIHAGANEYDDLILAKSL
jgi:hypothetical protein